MFMMVRRVGQGIHAEVTGSLSTLTSLLPNFCGSWGWNSNPQACAARSLLSQLVVGVKYYSHDMSPSVFLSCVLIGAG